MSDSFPGLKPGAVPGRHIALVEALRLHFRPEAGEAFRAALGPFGVSEALLSLAERCYALPMLASAVRRAGIEVPDPRIRHRLERAYYACAARRAVLHSTMKRVADLLTGVELPFLFLKGGALEVLAPEAPAVRITADLDVLVPRGEMANAERRLSGAGFRPRYAASAHLFRRHGHHGVPYELADGLGTVEIHEALAPRYAPVHLPAAAFWEHRRAVAWCGRVVYVPGPEEMLLHTCVHYGLLHAYNTTLRRLWDLMLLIETVGDPVDWSALTTVARRTGARKVIARAQAELAAVRGEALSVPQHSRGVPRPAGDGKCVQAGEWPLFDEPYSALAAFREEQALIDGPWRRCLSLWRFLFPGPHETAPLRADVAHWRYLLERGRKSLSLRAARRETTR